MGNKGVGSTLGAPALPRPSVPSTAGESPGASLGCSLGPCCPGRALGRFRPRLCLPEPTVRPSRKQGNQASGPCQWRNRKTDARCDNENSVPVK